MSLADYSSYVSISISGATNVSKYCYRYGKMVTLSIFLTTPNGIVERTLVAKLNTTAIRIQTERFVAATSSITLGSLTGVTTGFISNNGVYVGDYIPTGTTIKDVAILVTYYNAV